MSVHVCDCKCRCVGEVEEVVYSLFSLTFHFPKDDAILSSQHPDLKVGSRKLTEHFN